MATTKKTTEEVVEKEVKTTPAKEDKVSELESKLAEMQKMLEAMMANKPAEEPAKKSSYNLNEEVKIIHLVDRAPGLSTYMQVGNMEYALRSFGEERVLTIQQFEALIGKYRKWFEMGMLAVSAGYEEIATRYGLKTAAGYPINSEFLQNLGNVSFDEIERVYNRLPKAGQDSLISYWNRKIIEGDLNYKDRRKVESLNRLSGGALEQTLRVLNLEAKNR